MISHSGSYPRASSLSALMSNSGQDDDVYGASDAYPRFRRACGFLIPSWLGNTDRQVGA